MKQKIRIAAVQMDIKSMAAEQNAAQMVEWVARASEEHCADLVVFPELANIGYITDRDREFGEQYIEAAEPLSGATIQTLCRSAAQYGVYITVGICESHPTIPATIYNTAVLIGPEGDVRGAHRKMHIPGQEKHFYAAGNRSDVFKTDIGTIGFSICYDTFFPELARSLALKGAHILICPFNTAGEFDHPDTLRSLAQARAIENKMFVVTCNRTGDWHDLKFNGLSAAADPYGTLLFHADEGEGISIAEIDYRLLLQERAYHPVFIDRRPELYAMLTQIDGEPDIIPTDSASIEN